MMDAKTMGELSRKARDAQARRIKEAREKKLLEIQINAQVKFNESISYIELEIYNAAAKGLDSLEYCFCGLSVDAAFGHALFTITSKHYTNFGFAVSRRWDNLQNFYLIFRWFVPDEVPEDIEETQNSKLVDRKIDLEEDVV